MVEPLCTPLSSFHNSLIQAFRTLPIQLIPRNPLRLSMYTALIIELSSLYIIASLPYKRTGMSNASCSTLTHVSCRSLALTRDLKTPTTLLPLPTFQRYSATYVPDSSKTQTKYLNLDIGSNPIPSTITSHSNYSPYLMVLPCSYLHRLSDYYSYTPQQHVP